MIQLNQIQLTIQTPCNVEITSAKNNFRRGDRILIPVNCRLM